tara:strand:+ start:29976 stop:30188 length:213 start_codon:yes stop_codon:yes gene_type:complete
MELIDIVCVNNSGREDELTLNKVYYNSEIYNYRETKIYNVLDDSGEFFVYLMELFIPLSEYREKILTELL